MTDQQIEALLRDRECSWARVLRAGDERWVQVEHFILFARSRGLPTTDLEPKVERFVHSIGGRRERILDPWAVLPNVLRRLTGRLISPPTEVWVIPEHFLATEDPAAKPDKDQRQGDPSTDAMDEKGVWPV